MEATDTSKVLLIGRERDRIARMGINLGARVSGSALRYARSAARFGHDQVEAVRSVMIGGDDAEHISVVESLAQTMTIANLSGRRRVELSLGLQNLSREMDDEERKLMLFLLLDGDELEAIKSTYLGIAAKMVEDGIAPLLERIESSRSLGEIRDDFTATGFEQTKPFAITNLFTTGAVRGYEDGRFNQWRTPRIKELLWGFRYDATLDEKTTVLCRTLHGTRAPIGDPFWKIFTPPNHFFCRSVPTEIWRSDALGEPSVIQTRATPEQLIEFRAIKERFLSYF